MPNINDIKAREIMRQVHPIICVLDTSGSMFGDRIAAVNEAMRETMVVLKDISVNNPDVEIKLGVLQFSTGAEWVTNGLVSLNDFFWVDLKAGGVSNLSSALNELNTKLSRRELFASDTFCLPAIILPTIIFMCGGRPADDYEKALNDIKESNSWFRYARKIGIAVDDAADKTVLVKIAGHEEAVISVGDVEILKELIRPIEIDIDPINEFSDETCVSEERVFTYDDCLIYDKCAISKDNTPEVVKNDDGTARVDGWDDDSSDIWDDDTWEIIPPGDTSQFYPGKIIKTEFGAPVKIEKLLAKGGRSDVYLVDYDGEKKALKWYTNCGNNPETHYQLLKQKIEQGSPDSSFLWPRMITEKTEGSFGCIKDLQQEGYHPFFDFMSSKVEFSSFKTAVDACIKIVFAFKKLHNHGYCFESIDHSFLVNPQNGDIMFVDVDDIVLQGISTGVYGVPRYMAPEMIFKKAFPSVQTDNYSLSVLLFLLLCMSHPLEGRKSIVPCMTHIIEEKLYYSEALFMFDKNNQSNAPNERIHGNAIECWKMLPEYVKDAFCYAFSQEAIFEPDKRLREDDWLEVLNRFRSELVSADQKKKTVISRKPREIEVPVRKVLPIFYVFDTSGSMCGDRIAAVNEAMYETTKVLKDISVNNTDTEIKIAVLQFGSRADWVTNGLVSAEDFIWNDISAGGITALGAALDELHKKLSRREFFVGETGFRCPVVIFMSDGMPCDDYERALANIRENNKWFLHATKIGIAVGDDEVKTVLSEITGLEESVFLADDVETLKKLIMAISLTSTFPKGITDRTGIWDIVKREFGCDSKDENMSAISWNDEPWD